MAGVASTSSTRIISNPRIVLPRQVLNLTNQKRNNNHQLRRASSFVPGSSSRTSALDQQIPSLPKPPSTNWFTTHPSLTDTLTSLDDLIHKTRQKLYDLRVLKRFSAPPDFSGTGVRLRWLKWKVDLVQASAEDSNSKTDDPFDEDERRLIDVMWNPRMKWHDIKTMGEIIQGNEGRQLKMMEYRDAISKLNELKALKRYVALVKNLEVENNRDRMMDEIDSELDQVLLKFSRPEDVAQKSKDKDLGRDHLGRFYGLGKKKESTARVWMIEVKTDQSDSSSSPSEPREELVNDQPSEKSEPQDQSNQKVSSSSEKGDQALRFGQVLVNGRPISDYFYTPRQRATALRPLEITNSIGHYNVHVLTHGGGKMGQASAISHGLSIAVMKALNESSKQDSTIQERFYKKVLSKSSLTIRDPRVVERKKTGKPGAKSSYRWVKR